MERDLRTQTRRPRQRSSERKQSIPPADINLMFFTAVFMQISHAGLRLKLFIWSSCCHGS